MIGLTNHVKGAQPAPARPDARSERWREHRIAVREEFVAAAIRAIDRHGPDVSMGEIAKEAGAAKPKLYRHFTDRTDLYGAIVLRIQSEVWDRIMKHVDLSENSVTELLEVSVTEYAHVVDAHPDLFRFLVHSHFTARTASSTDGDPALDNARATARRIAAVLTDATGDQVLDVDAAEMVSYACFGAVASATDWWLGHGRRNDAKHDGAQGMDLGAFSRYVTAIVGGVIRSTCRLSGVAIEPDLPMHLAFDRAEGTGAQS